MNKDYAGWPVDALTIAIRLAASGKAPTARQTEQDRALVTIVGAQEAADLIAASSRPRRRRRTTQRG